LPGAGPEEELFSDFLLHPKDMKFEVVECNPQTWENLLSITSSHMNIKPVGRNIQLAVIERTSNKYVGFIRLCSPVINMGPRNRLLGQVFSQKPETARAFNKSAIMGAVIVPAQPFGFNYLGGKLLAGICCSHHVREFVNAKYDMSLCMFETTSLYGSSKTSSQYDGMKPYLKHKGETDSDFIPMMHGQPYEDLKEFVKSKVGPIVERLASSQKLKTSMRIMALTRAALRGTPEGEGFAKVLAHAKSLTERKRYYVSNYGFKNYLDVVNGTCETLVPDENCDSFKLENVVEWWRRKATNRYETLVNEGRLRTELELWTGTAHIDIIR